MDHGLFVVFLCFSFFFGGGGGGGETPLELRFKHQLKGAPSFSGLLERAPGKHAARSTGKLDCHGCGLNVKLSQGSSINSKGRPLFSGLPFFGNQGGREGGRDRSVRFFLSKKVTRAFPDACEASFFRSPDFPWCAIESPLLEVPKTEPEEAFPFGGGGAGKPLLVGF